MPIMRHPRASDQHRPGRTQAFAAIFLACAFMSGWLAHSIIGRPKQSESTVAVVSQSAHSSGVRNQATAKAPSTVRNNIALDREDAGVKAGTNSDANKAAQLVERQLEGSMPHILYIASQHTNIAVDTPFIYALCQQPGISTVACADSGSGVCASFDPLLMKGCHFVTLDTQTSPLSQTAQSSRIVVVSGPSSDGAKIAGLISLPLVYIHAQVQVADAVAFRQSKILAAHATHHIVKSDADTQRLLRDGVERSHIFQAKGENAPDVLSGAAANVASSQAAESNNIFILPEGDVTSFFHKTPHPPLTYAQIMALPSAFSLERADSEAFGVTVVMAFYRRAWTVPLMVLRLAGQTAPPREIWLAAFGSEIEKEIEAEYLALDANPEVQAIKARLGERFPAIRFLHGNIHLSYFGRFQLAIAAKTKYVAIWDDDTVPGTKVMHTLLHMVNTPVGEHSVIASRGHNLQCPILEDWHMAGRNPVVVEEDVVGGFWFGETELFRLLFRDKMVSWVTSEDSQFCAQVRKYTGRACLICPMNEHDPATTTQDPEFEARASEGDTTLSSNKMPIRTKITREIFMRGTPLRLRQMVQHPNGVMVYLHTCAHAAAIGAVFQQHASTFERLGKQAYYMVMSGMQILPSSELISVSCKGPTCCNEEAALQQFPSGYFHHDWLTMDCSNDCVFTQLTYGPFNLRLTHDIPGATRPLDILADAVINGQAVLELVMPRVVVLPYDDTPAVTGFAIAASYLNIPVILLGEATISNSLLSSMAINSGELDPSHAVEAIVAIAQRKIIA